MSVEHLAYYLGRFVRVLAMGLKLMSEDPTNSSKGQFDVSETHVHTTVENSSVLIDMARNSENGGPGGR